MKVGIITSYNPEKTVGTIFVNSTIGERYFFYGSKVVAGPQPTVGAKVVFSVSPRQPRPGQLPIAVNITVVPKDADIAALKTLNQEGSATPKDGAQ